MKYEAIEKCIEFLSFNPDNDLVVEAKKELSLIKEKITSDNSKYTKFPSFEDVYNHTGEIFEDDCRHVYDVIKELGNFA